jgi:hypothetical protein
MQILSAWQPVAGKLPLNLFILHATGGHAGTIFMQLATTQVQFACDWRPLSYNLNATDRQSHAIFACASGQLRANPPVFCKQAARTIT